MRPWPVRRGPFFPFVSVVMVVRNEEKHSGAQAAEPGGSELSAGPGGIRGCVGRFDGPHRRILSEAAKDPRCHTLVFAERKGKASRLNDGLAVAKGEIVLFMRRAAGDRA